MDSIKGEEYEYSNESPLFDFASGFEQMPSVFLPEHDANSLYSHNGSLPSSLSSSPTESMSVDVARFPPHPQLSNSHRTPQFLKRNQWNSSNMNDGSLGQGFSSSSVPYSGIPSPSMNDSMMGRATKSRRGLNTQTPYGGLLDTAQLPPPTRHEQDRSSFTDNSSFQPRLNNRMSIADKMEIAGSLNPSGMSNGANASHLIPAMQITGQSKPAGIQQTSQNGVHIIIETHPPVEVRTRTPSEKRNFSCSIQVNGDYKGIGAKFVNVELLYSPSSHRGPGDDEMPKQTILGGTKVVLVKSNGTAVFDNLSLSEASTKHKEKEFCLRFSLSDRGGLKLPVSALSTSFYAFSNTKVLARRRDITLRTLSKNIGSFQGGESMHVIGAPFIRGPALRLIFRTPHGDAVASDLELYSETVLFFVLPAYPAQPMPGEQEPLEVKVQVLVTNDGRNFSNPLDFSYISNRRNMRSYL